MPSGGSFTMTRSTSEGQLGAGTVRMIIVPLEIESMPTI